MTAPTTRILTLLGVEVLNLKPDNGHRRQELPSTGVRISKQRTGSPYVDSSYVTSWKREALNFTVTLKVVGADWVEVCTRVQALEAAVVDSAFLYEQGHDGELTTWRTDGPVDSIDSSYTQEDITKGWRVVTMSFTVHPNPTITGV